MEKTPNIVFGPVISRRFGRSLGVDLSPQKKQCNFDCVYCELHKASPVDTMSEVVEPSVVIKAIQKALKNAGEIDVLTFSANGEPTLYPHLYTLISNLKSSIPRHIKTLILSNGSRFTQQKEALKLFDIVKFSLDGAIYGDYKKVDRPSKNLDFNAILQGIKDFASEFKGELVAEVLLVAGLNDNEKNLKEIASFLREIRLSRVDLGSIDRPSAYNVKPVSHTRLIWASQFFTQLPLNIPKRISTNSQTTSSQTSNKHIKDSSNKANIAIIKKQSLSKSALLKLIATRPIETKEARVLFDKSTIHLLQECVKKGEIYRRNNAGIMFYTTN